MSRTIRKKCNGPNKHENEFNLDDLVRDIPVARVVDSNLRASDDLPPEAVMKCRFCTEGRVVFTRAELEQMVEQKR